MEKCRKNKELRDYYSFRRFVGAFFCLFGGINFYLRICERFSHYSKETELSSLPSEGCYLLPVFDSRYFEDLVTAEFCGLEVYIPKDYGEYLERMYGDYMKIPPEDEREIHVAYRIKI
jgi:lipopolysaccharide cholinephosphotransferase